MNDLILLARLAAWLLSRPLAWAIGWLIRARGWQAL